MTESDPVPQRNVRFVRLVAPRCTPASKCRREGRKLACAPRSARSRRHTRCRRCAPRAWRANGSRTPSLRRRQALRAAAKVRSGPRSTDRPDCCAGAANAESAASGISVCGCPSGLRALRSPDCRGVSDRRCTGRGKHLRCIPAPVPDVLGRNARAGVAVINCQQDCSNSLDRRQSLARSWSWSPDTPGLR